MKVLMMAPFVMINAQKLVKDIDHMIESFVEEERYEDCAFLVKIKDKVIEYYEKPLTKK